MKSAVVLVLLLCLPAAGAAQDHGAAIGAAVSAANMESHTDAAIGGTFAYRFSRVVELEIEASWVPRIRSDFPNNPIVIQSTTLTTIASAGGSISNAAQIFPTPYYSNPGGRIAIFTNAARIDIPTTATRVTPYFTAGGGVASVRRTADYTYPILTPTPVSGAPGTIPTLRPVTQPVVTSETDLAMTIGGGIDVRLTSALSIDADLRVFRLFGQDDRNLGRFGVGVRYRF